MSASPSPVPSPESESPSPSEADDPVADDPVADDPVSPSAAQAAAGPAPFPRFVVGAVVVLALALVVGAVAVALLPGDDETVPPVADASAPLTLPEIPSVAADSQQCASLVAALPAALASGTTQLDRRPLTDPPPAGAAAWGVDDPTVLRCGLDRPVELTQTAELLEIDTVRWLRLPDPDLPRSTYVAVDRPVYVALTLSDDTGTGPLQGVSRSIAEVLPVQEVDPVR